MNIENDNFVVLYLGFGFLLRGIHHPNNSLVTIDDIGTDNNALLCLTPFMNCCSVQYTSNGTLGDWFLPDGNRVENRNTPLEDFERNRGASIILLHKVGNQPATAGLFTCSVPNINKTIVRLYIGIFPSNSGKCRTNATDIFFLKHEYNIMYD